MTSLLFFVTRSPLNEDVFAAPTKDDILVTNEEIKDLQAKIYKLFLQVIISVLKKCIIQISIINWYKRKM